ncbi:MAG: sugar transferase [Ruminococcus sp.]|nr:sugar transferase [Ruminococcus sp.]
MSDNTKVSPKPHGVSAESSNEKLISIVPKPVYSFFKRFFDILVSFITLSVLIVPMLILALVIIIDSPGASPIYSQERVGKNGKRFKFYKFRSMIPNADEMLDELMDKNEMDGPAFKIKNDPRITRVGRFIRSSSIDELPQFWNVLKGDMSIVGPRPPLPREVEEYTEYQMQRLLVTPGITGYWQIQPKRNDLSFERWIELDLKYIEERSLKTDFVVLVKTVKAVCGLEGV